MSGNFLQHAGCLGALLRGRCPARRSGDGLYLVRKRDADRRRIFTCAGDAQRFQFSCRRRRGNPGSDVPAQDVASGLDAFYGTGRRFEKKGTYHGVPVIDDYAHHPTEIAATLAAARDILAPGRQNFCCIPAAYLFSGKLIPGGFHEGPEKSGYSHRDGDLFGAGKGSRYDLRSVYDAAFPGKRRTRKIHSGFFRNCGLSQILCKARRSHHYARRRRCQSCH